MLLEENDENPRLACVSPPKGAAAVFPLKGFAPFVWPSTDGAVVGVEVAVATGAAGCPKIGLAANGLGAPKAGFTPPNWVDAPNDGWLDDAEVGAEVSENPVLVQEGLSPPNETD